MEITHLTPEGHVLIPKPIRDAHHWSPGTAFVVEEQNGGIVLRPTMEKPFPVTIERALLTVLGLPNVVPEAANQLVLALEDYRQGLDFADALHGHGHRLVHGIASRQPIPAANVAQVPIWDYYADMRIIALSTLKAFWSSSPACSDAIEPGMAWYRETLRADWATPNEVKAQFSSASLLKDGRVVFNIAGNKYRLVVWINYSYRIVYVRFLGTHQQYDRIDAQTI